MHSIIGDVKLEIVLAGAATGYILLIPYFELVYCLQMHSTIRQHVELDNTGADPCKAHGCAIFNSFQLKPSNRRKASTTRRSTYSKEDTPRMYIPVRISFDTAVAGND